MVWLSLSGGKSPPPRDVRAIKKREKKTELFKWSEIDLQSEGGRLEGRHFDRPAGGRPGAGGRVWSRRRRFYKCLILRTQWRSKF